MNADQEANRLYSTLKQRCEALRKQFGKPTIIPLSVYETDDDIDVLQPDNQGAWTAAFHREIMEKISLKLTMDGFTVRLVTLNAAAYLRWLAAEGKTNSPAHRAEFISRQSQA